MSRVAAPAAAGHVCPDGRHLESIPVNDLHVGVITTSLGDDAPEVRRAAAEGAETLPDAQLVAPLVSLFTRDEAPETRRAVLRAVAGSKQPAAATDMVLNFWERTPNTLSWDPLARQIANLMVIVNKVYSQGRVSLQPDRRLRVQFNLLEDERDLRTGFDGTATDRDHGLHDGSRSLFTKRTAAGLVV